MSAPTGIAIIVKLPVQRRLLWEMRTRYDEATVDDILRLLFCARRERELGVVCGAVAASFVFTFILAVGMPGSVMKLWPSLVFVGVVALVAFVRAYRRMQPYGRARLAIYNTDPGKFDSIAKELAPLEEECLDGMREIAIVSLRL